MTDPLSHPKIAVRAVGKTFPSKTDPVSVLEGIGFDVQPGEFVALLGPSGCGKSTLLSIISGLADATAGEVRQDGVTINGPGPERGVLFQDYALFPWKTVEQNVEYGLKHGPKNRRPSKEERLATVERLITMVGLAGSEHKYPQQLSGGMRQRTALARLWAPDPDVLLMDEPLSALDAQTRLVMLDELLRIWGQEKDFADRKTTIYVTHAIDEAVFLADRVVVMSTKPGRIREIIDIDLPRPRNSDIRTDPRFDELHNKIWDLIRDEAYNATLAS